MKKEELLKKYLKNGFGYKCKTNELPELSLKFKKTREELLEELFELDNELKSLNSIELDSNLFSIVIKHNKLLNLVIIALNFESLNEFIEHSINKGGY